MCFCCFLCICVLCITHKCLCCTILYRIYALASCSFNAYTYTFISIYSINSHLLFYRMLQLRFMFCCICGFCRTFAMMVTVQISLLIPVLRQPLLCRTMFLHHYLPCSVGCRGCGDQPLLMKKLAYSLCSCVVVAIASVGTRTCVNWRTCVYTYATRRCDKEHTSPCLQENVRLDKK